MEFTLEDLDLSGEFESKEDALKAFHEKYVSREVAPMDPDLKKQIVGRRLGELTTHAKRAFGFQNSDVDGLKLEDVIQKGTETLRAKIEELEKKGGGEPDEKLTQQLNELKAKLEAKNNELMEVAKAKEQSEQEWQSKFTSYKVNDKLNSTLSSIPLISMDPIQRKGWEATIKEVDWRLNDEGELRPYKDDEPLKNEKGTGLLSAAEYLKKMAEEANLIKKNDKGERGGQSGYAWQNNQPTRNTDNPKPGEKGFVHPKLVARAEASRQR